MIGKMKVGLAVAIEMDAFFELYPDYTELETGCAFKLYRAERTDYELYVLQTGMGEIAAAAGVQYLISHCGVSAIINFGVVGGLTADMQQLKVCMVERVVHYKYDCSEFLDLAVGQVDGHDSIFLKPDEKLIGKALTADPGLTAVTCCSGDKFIGTAQEKQYLHETFEGDICDMESAGIVLACEINRVPCLLLKAVSDGLADGAEGFFAELKRASLACLKVAAGVIEEIAKISR